MDAVQRPVRGDDQIERLHQMLARVLWHLPQRLNQVPLLGLKMEFLLLRRVLERRLRFRELPDHNKL